MKNLVKHLLNSVFHILLWLNHILLNFLLLLIHIFAQIRNSIPVIKSRIPSDDFSNENPVKGFSNLNSENTFCPDYTLEKKFLLQPNRVFNLQDNLTPQLLNKRTMRFLFVLAFLCAGHLVHATNYYFSSVSGDDSRTGAQAQNPATPWKTLSKLNSFFSSLSAGDSVLFKRGETFYGSIVVSKSGTAANPIRFGAFGSGAKPIISGFTTVNTWTSLGSNIWESTVAASTLSSTNMVVINGANTAMGRYPNTGYLTYEGHTANTSITDNQLTATPNWTGAEVVIKMTHWVINRSPITSHAGTKINYTSSDVNYDPINGFGYFIQNDARTLDTQNEWYFDPATKKIKIYSSANPGTVQVASITDLVTATSKSYLTFDNISFEGANSDAFNISFSNNIVIQNCDITYSGDDAVYCYPNSPNLTVQNCFINHSNNAGINAASTDNAVIRNNTVNNTGIFAGMGKGVAGNYEGIISNGNNGDISYNVIKNTGYCGIKFDGNATVIKNNYIDYFCFIKDDGGGIYGYPSQGQTSYTQRTIKDNIVLNAIGAVGGTNDPNYLPAEGIYLDASASFADITNNTIGNCINIGLFLNNSKNVNSSGNTIYNCAALLRMTKFQNVAVINNTFNNNRLIARTATQRVLYLSNDYDAAENYFTGNNNYYARPIDDNVTIIAFADGNGGGYYNLASWKSFSGQDAGSKKSPKTITTVNDLRFEYNETSVSKTISLGANYIDVANVSYPGTITLAPYTSAVLIKNGTGNVLPAANAGADQTITLPASSVSLTGSGNDPDGTIASYAWTKITGPATGSITSPATATTTFTGLVQGVYTLELKVTDNSGGIGRDTLKVTVNAAGNQSPLANAGADQIIVLPTNSVTLTGSGTDSDGSIASYAWTKVSGPAGGSISSATAATTAITGLIQGIYIFELRVTDNNNASATDLVQVTVNAAPVNQAPTANAGLNQNITLPTNTATLSGSGSDVDGTIASYAWTKVSGPSGGTISSASSASTSVTSLIQGVYIYELRVTDNNGALATDQVQVTVNAAPANQAPIANAGLDQNITLPTSTATLTGSGSDVNGTIVSYVWTKVSGPSGGTITSASSASTTVTSLTQGIYKFELKVTDNGAAIGRDTVQVNVNASNQVPVANAGADQTITLPTSAVALTGSGTDSDGTISAYAWTKVSGPAAGNITTAAASNTTVTALVQGTYLFELKVTDNSGATDKDTLQVTVNAAPAANNAFGGTPWPIPGTIQVENFDNGGQDIAYYDSSPENLGGAFRPSEYVDMQNTTEGVAYIGWTDPGEWMKYSVNVLSSGVYTLQARVASLNAVSSFRVEIDGITIATITSPNTGGYQVWQSVTVNNISLSAGYRQMRIYCLTGGFNINFVTFSTTSNILPVANAGSDQTITLPTNAVSFTGAGIDPDGTVSAYSWTKVSGPAASNITNPAAANTSVTGLTQGVYKFELRVTDNSGGIGRDTLQVTVNASNQAPVANAGADKAITLPANSLTLIGSGSDADGTITSYTWVKISGPASGTIASASSATTNLTGLVQGVYNFQLTVSDNAGATDKDTVQVTVNTANQAPVANAGADKVITLPANTTTLVGSGTDPDGSITSYLWTKVSGPSGGTISTSTASTTNVTALVQGIYKFELRVTDDNGGIGAIGRDTVQVTVNAVSNQPPVANAGTDKSITLPVNSVTLSGSGTDADGTIASYTWTKLTGPATFSIASVNSAITTVNSLVQGVYTFELKVTDNTGANATDVVQVTVSGTTNTPYSGTPLPIPGTIEIEDYDNGGQNLAYYDVTAGNSGGFYRPSEAVDLQTATEGTAFLGWTNDGEWTKYTVNVTSAGTYTLIARVSTFSSVASCRVEMDGVTIATIAVPTTGGYQNWQNVSIPNIPLTAGIKTLRFYVEVGGFNITRMIFNQTGTSRSNTVITESTGAQDPVTIVTASPVSVYPNPVASAARIQINNILAGTLQLSLLDLNGTRIWKKTANKTAGPFTEIIEMGSMAAGIYILEVILPGNERKTYKIVKQ